MKISKDAEQKNTRQTILLFVFLAIVSLLLGSLPALSFGQGFGLPLDSPTSTETPPAAPAFGGPASVALSPADPAATAPGNFVPLNTGSPLDLPGPPPAPVTASRAPKTSAGTAAVADRSPTLPYTMTSLKAGTAKNQEPTPQQLQEHPELLRSVVAADHPFYNYFEPPRSPKNSADPQSPIQGKPLTVAQLLDGVRHPSARGRLLISYWELAGLLAESNIRLDSERRVGMWYEEANKTRNTQRVETFTTAYYLAQQQRKATEIAFAKKQYQLVEQLRTLQGGKFAGLALENYPIPCDYPIAKKYATYVDQIGRSERARYIGRLIPYQAELIDARKNSRLVADNYFVTTTRNTQANPQDWVSALNQRTDALVDLVAAVVDYNKTIAEYASETVGSNVSNYRLLGAVLELQKIDAGSPPSGQKPEQLAAPPQKTLSQLEDRQSEPSPNFAPESEPKPFRPSESAYRRPLADSMTVSDQQSVPPRSNPFTEVKSRPGRPTPAVAETAADARPAALAESAPAVAEQNPIQPASYTEPK